MRSNLTNQLTHSLRSMGRLLAAASPFSQQVFARYRGVIRHVNSVMNLKNSVTEKAFKKELIHYQKFSREYGDVLARVLAEQGLLHSKFIVMDILEDESELIFSLLLEGQIIRISIEGDSVTLVDTTSLLDYKNSLSKNSQIKLAVAKDMLNDV